jgi:hypothetical protein
VSLISTSSTFAVVVVMSGGMMVMTGMMVMNGMMMMSVTVELTLPLLRRLLPVLGSGIIVIVVRIVVVVVGGGSVVGFVFHGFGILLMVQVCRDEQDGEQSQEKNEKELHGGVDAGCGASCFDQPQIANCEHGALIFYKRFRTIIMRDFTYGGLFRFRSR